MACSLACLNSHIERAHFRQRAQGSTARAAAFMTEVNRAGTESWSVYAGHRASLMRLLERVTSREGICVLGAGNCNDLDLPRLVSRFGRVHLVDLDPEALERGLAQLSASERPRVTLHAGVDLSGCLDRIDAWGERLPEAAEFRGYAVAAADRLVDGIGESFGVVVSDCLLSQLSAPFQNTLALNVLDWMKLMSAIASMHLRTMALLLREGGRGIVACDVLSYAGAEANDLAQRLPPEELRRELLGRIEAGTILALPHPHLLRKQASTPPLSELIVKPELTEPWLWQLDRGLQLVYGLIFEGRHPKRRMGQDEDGQGDQRTA